MRRQPRSPRLALLLALSLLPMAAALAACGGSAEEADNTDAAQEAAWAELQEMKQALDAKRAELDQAREELAADGGEGAAELSARVDQLTSETQTMADEFNSRLVEYINANPPLEGEPLSERQQAAIAMKSDEDIVYAREYIREGGDYGRAIDIFNAALAVDPENAELRAALEEAERDRYMTEERFGRVRAGMSDDEVRAALGAPFYRNVREYEDGAVGWFYPTDPNRSAAAVYFRRDGDDLEVYKLDYRAVVNEGPAEAGGEVAANGAAAE